MNQFKTKQGTILPIMNLKGKDYLQVAHRLVWLREERPLWSIETEIVKLEEKFALARATIRDEAGRVIATGHKREDAGHFGDFIEKAETGAVGRALAYCGYGTQFCADELDEGDRIADAPTTPAKKIVSVRTIGTASDSATLPVNAGSEVYRIPFGKKHKGKTLAEIGKTEVQKAIDFFATKTTLTTEEEEFLRQAFQFCNLNPAV